MSQHVEGASSRPARSNTRHDRNRELLIKAAIDVLLGVGMAGFTSAHIAEAAGLHKPAFYAHFKNVEECLQAVAVHVAHADLRDSMKLNAAAMEQMPPDSEQWRATIELSLRKISEQAPLHRLLLRYRHADGPLGESLREIDRDVFDHWTEYFWRLAVHFGVDPKHFREIAQLAEHIVGLTYFAAEGVLTGRITDVVAEATRLQRYNEALVTAEVRRMRAGT